MRYGGLIIAIVIAAVAALVVLKMSITPGAPTQAPQQEQREVKTVNVYIAAKPIPIGSVISEDMLGVQPWPEHLSVETFVVEGDEKFNPIGMVARGAYQLNEPLIKTKLASAEDPNFIASDLPAGMRVVTIPLNEVDGVAGFVFPGDHVDLLYTHSVDKMVSIGDAPPTPTKETVTESLLTNVKILAIDQRASGANATDKDGKMLIPRSASVMVTPEDAQRVRLAQKTGTVSLALRALADRENTDPLLLTEIGDISLSDGGEEKGDSSNIKILRGAPATQQEELNGPSIIRGAEGGNTTLATPTGITAPTKPVVVPALVGMP